MTPNSKICPVCGTEFTPHRYGQIYCAIRCRVKKNNKKQNQRQRFRNQQEPEAAKNSGQVKFEPINLPDNGYRGRQPDPYRGF